MNLERRVLEWLAAGDAGVSSETIVSVMMDLRVSMVDIPHDPSDFGRCHRLLEWVPEFRPRLGEVAAKYPDWAPLVESWDRLTAIYLRDPDRGGTSPELYRVMQGLLLRGNTRERARPAYYVVEPSGEVDSMRNPLLAAVMQRFGDTKSAIAIPAALGLVRGIPDSADIEMITQRRTSYAVVSGPLPLFVKVGDEHEVRFNDRWDVSFVKAEVAHELVAQASAKSVCAPASGIAM